MKASVVEMGAVLVHDGRFEYETGGVFPRSACRVRMYEDGARLNLVASELADNLGAWITTTAELTRDGAGSALGH